MKWKGKRGRAHRDVAGVVNIALLHGGGFNGVLAHPLLLKLEA